LGIGESCLHAIAELSEQGTVARLVAQSLAGSFADEPPEKFTPPYLAQRILSGLQILQWFSLFESSRVLVSCKP
jgi:hypothetical protein